MSRPLLPIFTWPVLMVICLASCGRSGTSALDVFTAEDLRSADRKLLEVAMEDVFSPPVAARVYVYPHLAHYATLRLFHPDSLADLGGVLKDWPSTPIIPIAGADPQLSALLAFCKVGRILVFSELEMEELTTHFMDKALNHGMDKEMVAASEHVAELLTAHIKPWMDSDRYAMTRTLDRFSSSSLPGHWVETSPDYGSALEPHWQKMRTMTIQSASFDTVPPMPPYSTDPASAFYAMVEEVHQGSKTLTDSTRMIALYWDDNPNISTHRGHLVIQEHRISPPGHWLNIISQVSRSKGSDVYTTTKAYTLAAIAMYDGVIACWNEKFRTDLVRPITYIQELIEPDWGTVIQTPPFPEYPSGHSVTSAAAGAVLTAIYGDNVAFTDSTEMLFGLGARTFPSFNEAAWEVSMSRFYGGIHYMKSIEEGNRQGRKIGEHVINVTKN